MYMYNVDGRGQKRKATASNDRFIKQMALKDKKILSEVKLANEVQMATPMKISEQKICNQLHKTNTTGLH